MGTVSRLGLGLAISKSIRQSATALQSRLLYHAWSCSSRFDISRNKTAENLGYRPRYAGVVIQHRLTHGKTASGGSEKPKNGWIKAHDEILLQLVEKKIGENHMRTLGISLYLGMIYADRGKLDKAEDILIRTLRGYETHGLEQLTTLEAVFILGSLYERQKRYDEAEEMWLRVVKGFEEKLGPKHSGTLHVLKNLANLYRAQNKLDNAEKVYTQMLQRCEEKYGWKSTQTLPGGEEMQGWKSTHTITIANALAEVYVAKDKLDDAENLYIRVLQSREEAFGVKHLLVMDTVYNLGLLYEHQGQLDKAEEMLMRALQGRQESLGSRHVLALDIMGRLGKIYKANGKKHDAWNMLLQVLQSFEELLGPDMYKSHPQLLDTTWKLADMCADDKPGEARILYEKALSQYRITSDAPPGMCQYIEDRLNALNKS